MASLPPIFPRPYLLSKKSGIFKGGIYSFDFSTVNNQDKNDFWKPNLGNESAIPE